jgi:signal transduction histidine kinase
MSEEHDSIVAMLLRLGVTDKGDWDGALQQVLEIACNLLNVERASFWSVRDDPPSIVCELGYVRSKQILERGMVIEEQSCPEYFAQVRKVQVVAIADTAVDPRAHSLGGYLEAYRIRGLLDVPVFAQDRLAGILCHEHVESPRQWTTHEFELALMVGHTVSALLEARARNYAEKSERRCAFLGQVFVALAQTPEPAQANELAVRRAVPVLGDISMLIACDGEKAWRVAQADVDPGRQAVLDELCGGHECDLEGPGLWAHALRERHSLLMPTSDAPTLRNYGYVERQIELFEALKVRSLMSVLLHARARVTGVLTFGSRAHIYCRDDLRFAETYANQVGMLLENTRLHAEAQAALRARDEFLALAGHELRTPLTSLTYAVDLLQRGLVRRAADVIARQTARFSRLIDLITCASQEFDGALPLRFERLDLAELARGVTQDLADSLARAGCEVRLNADRPVTISGDRAGLEVAVSNLLTNAIKFGAGKPVEVTVGATDTTATLVVRDHGVGIPADQQGRVFERYERAVSSSHFGGLGLGLYITSKIVKAHGGDIRTDSRVGEGAAFTIELPKR